MINFIDKLKRSFQRLQLYCRLFQINRKVAAQVEAEIPEKPIVFFNATARIKGLNLNAAFSMITSWGIQMAGRRVVHFSCRSGMSHCVLGAGLGDPQDPPPCQECIRDSGWFTGSAPTSWFDYQENIELKTLLNNKSVSELEEIKYKGRPLGRLVLTSIRWILRRYHLEDDEITRYLYGEFILSAHNIAEKFSEFIGEIDPETVVVFNGLQYPEAVIRWVATQRGIRVITYEVNLRPFSAFFTDGQATEYSLNIPQSFNLTKNQNRVLDQYLQLRFRGDFKMAGIKFWSTMDQLPADFLTFANRFEGLVPVFTNVIFDTSQAQANTIFPHMFAWLDLVRETAEKNPKILFVIRAHPDEMRKGKSSQESVISWVADQGLENLPNVMLIGPEETLSSYELIQHSKFTLVYNSSIGLEATLLGSPVLCAGKARYTQYPTVFYPDSLSEYKELLTSFLVMDEIHVPDYLYENARRFLFYQLYRASLPFDQFLSDFPRSGYVHLKRFSWKKLLPGSSPVVDCVVNGILNGDEFILETDLDSDEPGIK